MKRLAATEALGAAAMTIDEAAERYWIEVGQHSRERDLQGDIARLIDGIGQHTTLADITDDTLARLVARRRGSFRMGNPKLGPISVATVNRTTTELLRRILTRARKVWRLTLPAEPDYGQHMLSEPQERVRELTHAEEARIETAERADYRPPRLFAQATGLRRREVVSLTWRQVDFAAGVIRVVGKGDKPHVIPITPEITEILWPLREHHRTAVFTYICQRTRTCAKSGQALRKNQRYPITEQGWATAHRRTMILAEVEDMRIHDLRHTAATRTLRGSKNIRAVQKLLGHADIKTTMRYAHAALDDVAEAMRARAVDEADRRAMHDRDIKSRDFPEEGKAKRPKRSIKQRGNGT